jgi:hypothetical protein
MADNSGIIPFNLKGNRLVVTFHLRIHSSKNQPQDKASINLLLFFLI